MCFCFLFLPFKHLVFLIGEFSPFTFKIIINRYVLILKNVDYGHHLGALLLPCYSSLVSPRREIIHLSWTPIFVLLPKGHLKIALLWWPAEFMLVVPQDCTYLHTLKAPFNGLASNQPKFNCWDPILTFLGRYILKYWELLKIGCLVKYKG